MPGIRIRDLTTSGSLGFDLAELLRAVGTEAATSEWICQGVWSTAKETATGNPLESFADVGRRVSGADLIAAAKSTAQTIDGEFLAYRSGQSEPWLCLKAIDSSFWEAFSADRSILDQLRASFSVVTELPGTPDMNHYQKVAILLVRVMATIAVVLGLLGLLYGAVLLIYGAPMTGQQSERWISSLWYIGLGLALFFGSGPLGRFLGRGLE